METTHSIMSAMTKGFWATSLDLQDAFFHTPVARQHRKFLRFRFGPHHFQFSALPFGLALSPYIFTRVVKPVGTYAHRQGLNLLQYLDDWLLTSNSKENCTAWTCWLTNISESLGLLVNLLKSDLEPSQEFQFIGIKFDLLSATAQLAPHRIETFLQLAARFRSTPSPSVVM